MSRTPPGWKTHPPLNRLRHGAGSWRSPHRASFAFQATPAYPARVLHIEEQFQVRTRTSVPLSHNRISMPAERIRSTSSRTFRKGTAVSGRAARKTGPGTTCRASPLCTKSPNRVRRLPAAPVKRLRGSVPRRRVRWSCTEGAAPRREAQQRLSGPPGERRTSSSGSGTSFPDALCPNRAPRGFPNPCGKECGVGQAAPAEPWGTFSTARSTSPGWRGSRSGSRTTVPATPRRRRDGPRFS